MLKRLELRKLLFNDYAMDGFMMPKVDSDWTNLYVDNEFEMIQKGIDTPIKSTICRKGSIYNTCILQFEDKGNIEFRVLNNNNGTFTYMILRPLTVKGIRSYVPVLQLKGFNKNIKVTDINFIPSDNALSELIKFIDNPEINITVEKMQMCFEILRIKLLIKESVRDNGCDIASVVSVLALNTTTATYSGHMNHSITLLETRKMINYDENFQDIFESAATYLIVKDNNLLSMPIDNAVYMDGVIVLTIDPSKYDNLYIVTLGKNTLFTKSRLPEENESPLLVESVVASREEMIELELNSNLRKIFKLLNK